MQNVVKDICEESRVTGNGPMFMAKYRDRDNDDKSTSFDGFPIYSASSPVSSPARNSNSCNQQDLGKDTGYSKIDRASNGVKELKPEIILQELSERYKYTSTQFLTKCIECARKGLQRFTDFNNLRHLCNPRSLSVSKSDCHCLTLAR